MKKFFIEVVIVICCVFALDFGIGCLFDYALTKMPNEGDPVAKSNYSLYRMHADIVITGSSRSSAAIDSRVVLDNFPVFSVYNCSQPGQEFVFSNTLINCLFDRYTPRMIIWDFKENELSEENRSEMSLLHPYYYSDKRIQEALNQWQEPYFEYKILMNSFRYNKTGSRILRSIFAPIASQKGMYGFEPTDEKGNNTLTPTDFVISDDTPVNSNKLKLLEKTLQRAASVGCQIVITVTPVFNDYNADNVYAKTIKGICEKYHASFLDNSHLKSFVHKNEFYHDRLHMNGAGALKYTSYLCGQLKQILSQKQHITQKSANSK